MNLQLEKCCFKLNFRNLGVMKWSSNAVTIVQNLLQYFLLWKWPKHGFRNLHEFFAYFVLPSNTYSKIGKMSRHWLWMIPQELFPPAHLKRLYWLPKKSYFVMQFSLDSTVCCGWFFHAAKVILANRGKYIFFEFKNWSFPFSPQQFCRKKSRCGIKILKA